MARRFLLGLSTEELRYIAPYFGACLLESEFQTRPASRREIAGEILQYESCCASRAMSGDTQHKMILLLEYLSSCQYATAMKIAAGSA